MEIREKERNREERINQVAISVVFIADTTNYLTHCGWKSLGFSCIYVLYMVFPHVIFVVNFSCGSFNNVTLLFNISSTVQLLVIIRKLI